MRSSPPVASCTKLIIARQEYSVRYEKTFLDAFYLDVMTDIVLTVAFVDSYPKRRPWSSKCQLLLYPVLHCTGYSLLIYDDYLVIFQSLYSATSTDRQ